MRTGPAVSTGMLTDPLPGFRYRKDPESGALSLEVAWRGEYVIHEPMFNKGTAFPEAEREALELRGHLPPRVVTMEQQIERVMWSFERQESDLERYLHLMAVLDRNETLFYRLLVDRLEDLLPVVYTPTVGLACQNFGRIYRRSRGLYLTPEDADRIDELFARWPCRDVRVVVVTDGERVLGLGDLGAGGMGISIGKASLYVAAAGIHPARVLPICLDTGTQNERLRADPLYLGRDRERVRGPAYDHLIERFFAGVRRHFPHAVVQFEDFASGNALRLLAEWRRRACCFNDDIQGTGTVARAAVLAGLRDTGRTMEGLRVVIAGGGSAGLGIAAALSDAEVWVADDRGLLTADRDDLIPAQRRFTRHEPRATLLATVRRVRPHVLVGVTGAGGVFTREMVQALSGPRPLVLPLSNPTSLAECTPAQVEDWTGGLARVATGSPFPGVAQCNNAYVFPGVGLGIVASEATRVTDGMLAAAADALAAAAPPDRLLPPLRDIRSISVLIAKAVARAAVREDVAPAVDDAVLDARIADAVWDPVYVPYRAAPPVGLSVPT